MRMPDQAEFTDATTLQLTRVMANVQYHDTYQRGAHCKGARAASACTCSLPALLDSCC